MRRLLGSSLLLAGCVSQTSVVRDRFEYEYDCGDVQVSNIGGTTYVASGCGNQATYTCQTNVMGKYSAEAVCVREAPVERERPVQQRAAASSPGKAFRRYDEDKKAQVVQADFGFRGGARVRFVGAPALRLGDILVQLHLPTKQQEGCEALDALVNDVPTPATEVSSTTVRFSRDVSAHLDFQQLKPLAQSYPSFAFAHCGLKMSLSETDVAELRKFLVMYSDIAKEVQATAAPAPPAQDPASANTLEL